MIGNVDTDADYVEALMDFITARKEYGEGLDRSQSERPYNRNSYMRPFDERLLEARSVAEVASVKYQELRERKESGKEHE